MAELRSAPRGRADERIAVNPAACSCPAVTGNAFVDWLAEARPGDMIEYHRGHLASDRIKHANAELRILIGVVWQANARGAVTLIQRRYGVDDYGYIAVRSRS